VLTPDDRLLAAVGASLVAAAGIAASGRRPWMREAWTFAAAIVKLLLVISLRPHVLAGELVESAPFALVPGLTLHLRADPFGLLFALVASSLWLVTSLYTVFASLRALGEGHLKRRLAYSTVGQLSYIVLGAAVGSPAALAGAMFHIAAHGAMKITMFFCAGAIYTRTHIEQIARLGGIGRRMPLTMGAFAVCAFGLAGIPPVAGFVSKWNLGVGALQAEQPIFLAVLLVSGLMNIGYFFPIVQHAFFGVGRTPAHDDTPPDPAPARTDGVNGSPRNTGPSADPGHDDGDGRVGEAAGDNGPAITVPLLVSAAAALALGVWPDVGLHLYELSWQAALSVVASGAGGSR
jgi:formate hydrogenlyase subunit 3/multisubunit Na+/H+ antiporter MnhD subunit